jgi:hypothetical protein
MKRALLAATAYFLALFVLGFVLGTVRVTVVAPRLGALAATAAEVPIMLAAALFASRWAVRRWRVPGEVRVRLAMAVWFLTLLVSFETLLGIILFGRSPADQMAAFATPAGSLGLAAQAVAAGMLLWVDHGQAE